MGFSISISSSLSRKKGGGLDFLEKMATPECQQLLLLGDIGGTSTRLRLIDGDAEHLPSASLSLASGRYVTADYPSVDAILQHFLVAHQDTWRTDGAEQHNPPRTRAIML